MSRRRRRWWIVAVVVIVLAGAATAAVLLLGGKKTAAVRYLTATATKGTIAKTVQADFTLASARSATTLSAGQSTSSTASSSSASSTTSSATSVSTSQTGVVTSIALAVGKRPRTLQRLLTVSGEPLFAFVSSAPLYENLSTSLSSGVDAANVKVLQTALKAGGYFTGTVDGDFGSATQTALEGWQADNSLTETGKVDITKFVWVPTGAVLNSWSVSLGSQLSGQTALASVDFPRQLVAQALVSQADISSLKVGQAASLTIDGGIGSSFTGTVAYIDSQPASSSSSGSSTSTASYTVTFRLKKLPSLAKSGMTGSLEVTLAKRTNVLLVPTRAIVGTSSSPYVRVMVDGKPVMRQVTVGMTTSSYTQVASGLAAGETVMTGQYSTGTTTTTTGTTTRRSTNSLGIPGLGSGAGQGGPPAGGGQ